MLLLCLNMDDNCVIIDVTTVITLVSDTSHRPKDLVDKFTNYVDTNNNQYYYNKIRSITGEIQDEVKNPLYPKLLSVIKGKKLLMVEEAYERINNEMKVIMNTDETKRYDELMKSVKIIKSDISERFKKLDQSRWKRSNRAVFGTADKLKIKLLTGNKKAVITVLDNYAFDMDITVHRSRDLISNRILELIEN